jgi:hypothetical protein
LVTLNVNSSSPVSHRVLNILLNGAFEGPGTELGVISLIAQKIPGRRGHFYGEIHGNHPVEQTLELNINDLADLLLTQRVEHHDIIHTIQELGGKSFFQRAVDNTLGILILLCLTG